ncbi:MAG: alpha-E domain-containing protein, partial [Burkholderiaceae bacterium]
PQMPRSLRFCFDQVVRLLSRLPVENARPARQLAATMLAQLEFAVIHEILEEGLHGYLERFVDQTIQLGELIREAYLELE